VVSPATITAVEQTVSIVYGVSGDPSTIVRVVSYTVTNSSSGSRRLSSLAGQGWFPSLLLRRILAVAYDVSYVVGVTVLKSSPSAAGGITPTELAMKQQSLLVAASSSGNLTTIIRQVAESVGATDIANATATFVPVVILSPSPTSAPIVAPSSSSSSKKKEKRPLSDGDIAGIVIGGVVFLGLVGGALFWCYSSSPSPSRQKIYGARNTSAKEEDEAVASEERAKKALSVDSGEIYGLDPLKSDVETGHGPIYRLSTDSAAGGGGGDGEGRVITEPGRDEAAGGSLSAEADQAVYPAVTPEVKRHYSQVLMEYTEKVGTEEDAGEVNLGAGEGVDAKRSARRGSNFAFHETFARDSAAAFESPNPILRAEDAVVEPEAEAEGRVVLRDGDGGEEKI
jgi:hypothetical protein